jgi:hypothetical protein
MLALYRQYPLEVLLILLQAPVSTRPVHSRCQVRPVCVWYHVGHAPKAKEEDLMLIEGIEILATQFLINFDQRSMDMLSCLRHFSTCTLIRQTISNQL